MTDPPQVPLSAPLSIDDLRALAQLVTDFDLADFELVRPGGEKLRIRRGPGLSAPPRAPHKEAEVPVEVPAHASPEGHRPLAQQAPNDGTDDDDVRYITSPFVGTFYRSASPDTPPYVEPGQRVRKGQTLCIIEAMKLMNELEAEIEGVVLACLADNGRPVEYGQPLFRIRTG